MLVERIETVLSRVGAFMSGTSEIHRAAEEIARRFGEQGIDYAVAGAIALGAYGVMRATEDVDVLITPEGLERFKAEWLGRGYVEVRRGGKAVRDTATGVRIDFLLTGDYPGDGKPKPVAFPNPARTSVDAGRYRVVPLSTLLELKTASGMTAPHRLQDLADVLRLIRENSLPRDYAEQLDPYVRAKFDELWQAAQHPDEDY